MQPVSPTAPALVISGLSKKYPNGTQALHQINLEIPRGMFGLLGPNGAGKSTLMRTLATLQDADTGSARLGDLDMLRDKRAVRQVLGYLPQSFGVYPYISAIDMLDHFARLKGIHHTGERKAMVEALLRQTNLWEVRNRQVGKYSGGMKQRFGIAQALLGNPQLIIVDEPTAGLDPAERNRFHNLLSEIGENIIVILSTHIVEDVSDLCEQMAIIHRGEVLVTGIPQELIAGAAGWVWETVVPKDQLQAHQQQYNVISSRHFGGNIVVRVWADTQPDTHFSPASGRLEDIYFARIKERETAQAAATA
ncbi:MAG: ABC transporter ATP-binding protein [Bacteroidia bacterium]|nr:ABC transporter ATP-binding protein [Bacteroidia bacterium]